jgi:biotin operon repressor
MAIPIGGIEDLAVKRALLALYRERWTQALMRMKPDDKQRAQIVSEIDTLLAIDEDLLRAHGKKTVDERPYDRRQNEIQRDEILHYLLDSSEPVTLQELGEHFGLSDTKVRNLMRALRDTGRVVLLKSGYKALPPLAGDHQTNATVRH